MGIGSVLTKDGHIWRWMVISPLATFKGQNRTKWGAKRNIKRIWLYLETEPKSEKPSKDIYEKA